MNDTPLNTLTQKASPPSPIRGAVNELHTQLDHLGAEVNSLVQRMDHTNVTAHSINQNEQISGTELQTPQEPRSLLRSDIDDAIARVRRITSSVAELQNITEI